MNQSNPVSWPKSDALPWVGWVFTPMPSKHCVRTAPRCLGCGPAISGDAIFRRCKSWGHDVWGRDARKTLRAEFLYPGSKSPKPAPSWGSFNRPVWDVRCFHFLVWLANVWRFMVKWVCFSPWICLLKLNPEPPRLAHAATSWSWALLVSPG